jgi:hypothetical protein
MRIEMSREIRIKAYEVVATLAFPEDRTEVLSILQMAANYEGLSGAQVVDKKRGLLPGRPEVMGTRLLNMAAGLDLLEQMNDRRFVITDFGRETLANETIFIPEESSWKIWVTEDSIFPSSILHVERHNEKFASHDSRVEQLPKFITDIKDTSIELLRTHHTDSAEFRIKEIKPKGRFSDSPPDLNLIIIADYGQETIARVKGVLGTGKSNNIDRRVDFEGPEHLELFTRLVNQSEFGPDWNEQKGVLNVVFAETNTEERRQHLKTIRIDTPNLEDLGEFNSVELKAIPLTPKTGYNAREWAKWDFWSDFSEQPWSNRIGEVWDGISARYELASHGLSSPPDISARVDALRSSMLAEQISVQEVVQLRRCQAVIDLGGDSS